jgi:hypothetical protein
LDVRPHELDVENQDAKDDDLAERPEDNVSPHERGDDGVASVVWLSLQKSIIWWFSGKGKGGEGIHNHVNPKKLDSGQWSNVGNSGSNEDSKHSDDVNSQLELQEFSDVVKDVSSEFNSGHDRSKVIIHKNDIASLLGNLGSGDSHGESNISLLKSWSIISSITSDSDNLSHFLESSN